MQSILALLVVTLACLLGIGQAFTFAGPTAFRPSPTTSTVSKTQLEFFGPKDDGSPGDYVCLDCGYVFTRGPKAWAALPADYSCPPCGSAKHRFKKVPKGSAK